MPILLAAGSTVISIWLLRLALSERLGRYPAPGLGRAAFVGLAVGILAAGLSAAVTVALQDDPNSSWPLRLAYGAGGIAAGLMCVAGGLYAHALAPGAYQRQHPRQASEFGTRATAVTGRLAGTLLVVLGFLAIPVTVYAVVAVPSP